MARFNAAFAAHTAEQFIEDVLSRAALAYATSWSVTISASAKTAQGRFRDASASRETAALRRRGNADTRARRRAGFELGGAGGARGGRIDDAGDAARPPIQHRRSCRPGNRIGRTIGFPTANIQLKHRRTPLSGEYVVTIEGLGSEPRRGVANVGVRPSVSDSGKPMLEVNIFDWNEDCYGAHLRISFVHKLRAEMKFDGLTALRPRLPATPRSPPASGSPPTQTESIVRRLSPWLTIARPSTCPTRRSPMRGDLAKRNRLDRRLATAKALPEDPQGLGRPAQVHPPRRPSIRQRQPPSGPCAEQDPQGHHRAFTHHGQLSTRPTFRAGTAMACRSSTKWR